MLTSCLQYTVSSLTYHSGFYPQKQRPQSAGSMKKGSDSSGRDVSGSTCKSMQGLNSDEIKVLRRLKEEDSRKGGWVRIFPTADSWDLYA